MHIQLEHVTHLEGSIPAEKRKDLWSEHRVIFCTPQTAFNDLQSGRLSAESIVCVVIDEAHKATGSYAYTSFMNLLASGGSKFRVLALSATPGSDLRKIQEVRTHKAKLVLPSLIPFDIHI
jgi:Fanconi anemia group M protein